MRNIEILLLTAILFGVPSCLNMGHMRKTITPEGAVVKTSFPEVTSFDGIDVASIIKVEIQQGERESVAIYTNENIIPFVQVRQEGKELFLCMDNKYHYKNVHVRAVITMKELRSINMSGASKGVIAGAWSSDQFKLQMSGVSELKGGNIAAPVVDVQLSGVSELEVCFAQSSLSLTTSGSSEAELTLSQGNDVAVVASGASDIKLRGEGKELILSGSGSAGISAKRFKTLDVTVSQSGASKASVFALKSISYSLSGASKLTIYGDATVVSKQTLGASKVSLGSETEEIDD